MDKTLFLKFSRGEIYINAELFIIITGLNDDRNNMKKVREYMKSHGAWNDNFIYYESAVQLALSMMKTGKFWMYSDIVDVHNCGMYRRILDFVEKCGLDGLYKVNIL